MTDTIPASEIEAIRGRHKDAGNAWTVGYFSSDDGFVAHTDRATLLRALDAMAEKNVRLIEALKHIESTHALHATGVGAAVAEIMQGIARAALKEPLCDTTQTQRLGLPCHCDTYEGNLGPCAEFEEGGNKRCAYCDHAQKCHPDTALKEPGQ